VLTVIAACSGASTSPPRPAPPQASAPARASSPAPAPGVERAPASKHARAVDLYATVVRLLTEISDATALHATDCPAMALALKEVLDRHESLLVRLRASTASLEDLTGSERDEWTSKAMDAFLTLHEKIGPCMHDLTMQDQLDRFMTRVEDPDPRGTL